MKKEKTLYEFINEICKLLEIESPKIVHDESVFLTSSQLGAMDINNNTLYLRSEYKTKFDELFTIAHELRHVYQSKNILWRNSLNSRRKNNESTTEFYNNQISELDANAFAAYIMMEMFKIKPMFIGLDKVTKAKIFNLAYEIKKELKIKGYSIDK